MIRKSVTGARIIILLALTAALIFGAAAGESYDAGTMRLLRYEGNVEIFDPEGNPRFVLENVRFASGEALQTGEESTASVGLDDTKIVTLDASSRVDFAQEAGHLKLKLSGGTLFLDVTEKLDENESLDIETSTMTVGIRGTITFLSESAPDAERPGVTTFGVLEGVAQIDYTDTSGSHRLMDVPAGSKVKVPDPGTDGSGVAPELSKLAPEDVAGFVLNQVLEDEKRIERVLNGSPAGELLLNPDGAGPEGVQLNEESPYAAEITLVAQSASKLYDGQPLRRSSDVLVYGLPQGFSIQVSAGGVRTDAGECENPIANYHIYNSENEDVTHLFTNVKKVSGQLKVDPVPMTAWTGSAEKYYDGKPLTNSEAELRTIPGYVSGEPEWRNTSIVTRTALGSENMIAVSGNIWVHGTNPITGESKRIVLYTGQRLTVVLHSDGGQDSIEFAVETLSVADLPDEVLRLYADNPRLMKQACRDTGWDEKELTARIRKLEASKEKTVRRNGLKVSESSGGDLLTDSSNVRINVDSDITNYNSRPLTGNEAHFTPIELDPSIVITATGSQTEPGESPNTYEIEWGGAKKENYIITEELGTLTVLPVYKDEAVLTAASAEKVYDGKPLEAAEIEITGLRDGYTVEATVEGSQTDAGEGENKITEYKILDRDGKDVTEAFPNLKAVSGTLTVKPAPLTVKTGSAEKVYDGEPLTGAEAEISGLVNGETAGIAATGTLTEAGSAKNTFEITWGTAKKDNYEVTEETGTLTVKPLEIELNVGGKETSYTGSAFVPEASLTYGNGSHAGETIAGTRLRAMDVMYRFTLFTGETVDLTITGMGTGAGTYTLTGSVSTSSGSSVNLNTTFSGTTLTIGPAALTVSTGSASKYRDGTPLTCSEATVAWEQDGEMITVPAEGPVALRGEDTVTVTVTGTITEKGTAENTFTLDWGDTDAGNYQVEEKPGTLEILVIDTPVTLTAESATRAYDGTALTASGITAEGLPAGCTCEAEVTGSQRKIGSSASTVSSYTIFDADGADVTEAFTNVTTVDGTLTVTVNDTPVTITANSESFVYCGKTMNGFGSCTVEGLPGTITYLAEAMWGAKHADTYTLTPSIMAWDDQGTPIDLTEYFSKVTFVNGTLTVEPLTVKINMGGGEYVYDGQSHGGSPSAVCDNTDFTLANTSGDAWRLTFGWGDFIEFPVSGSWKNPGSYSLENTGYTIGGTNDEDLPRAGDFDISFSGGSVTIKPLQLIFDLNAGGERTFGYEPTTLIISATYGNGPHAGEELGAPHEGMGGAATIGAQTNRYGTYAGDDLTLGVSGCAEGDAGTYTISHSFNCETGSDSNYEITILNDTYTVKPATVTITTGSAEKYYDGTPLTCGELTVNGLVGNPRIEYAEGQRAVVTVTGSQTEIGESENTYSIDWRDYKEDNYIVEATTGTLTVKGHDEEVTFTAKGGSKEYDGTPLTSAAANVEVSGLPEGYTWEAAVSGSRTDAGTTACTLDSYTIYDAGHTDVTASFTNVQTVNGELVITPMEVQAALNSYNPVYTGKPVLPDGMTVTAGGSEVEYEEMEVSVSGDTLTAVYSLPGGGKMKVTCGGFTDAGPHTYSPSVSFTAGNGDNYHVTVSGKDFTISKVELTINLGGGEYTYDGEFHGADPRVYCDSYGWEGWEAVKSGSKEWTLRGNAETAIVLTFTGGLQWNDAGDYTLSCTPAVSSGNGGNFDIQITGESVKINKSKITVTTHTETYEYDGYPLPKDTDQPVISGGYLGADVYASVVYEQIQDVGTVDNACEMHWGTEEKDNYDVTYALGKLTVEPRELTISSPGAEKTYDGTPLTAGPADISGLAPADEGRVTAEATGSITNAGTAKNSITINWGSVKSGNYTVTKNEGTLKVNKRKLIITSGSAEKVWDGAPLTCSTYEIGGDRLASGEDITVNFTGSLTGSATDYQESDNTFTVTFNPGDEGNYDLELRYGKLTVYPPAPVTDGGF